MPAPRLRVALLALLLPLVLGAPITRAAAPSVLLEALTSTELRDRIAAGDTTILVPVGGTEQSGPHLALGKHNRRVLVLSERIAQAVGHALVAPVVAYVPEGALDPPSGHMRFPGTITVPSETFVATLESAGRSFRAAGFRDIVLLGDHGGYQKDLQRAAQRLNRRFAGSGVRAHAVVEYYDAADAGFRESLRARGYRDDEIGRHAGLADTSLTLAIDPSLVRTDRLGTASGDRGVDGDPTRSSAELGRQGADAIVARTADVIRKAVLAR